MADLRAFLGTNTQLEKRSKIAECLEFIRDLRLLTASSVDIATADILNNGEKYPVNKNNCQKFQCMTDDLFYGNGT